MYSLGLIVENTELIINEKGIREINIEQLKYIRKDDIKHYNWSNLRQRLVTMDGFTNSVSIMHIPTEIYVFCSKYKTGLFNFNYCLVFLNEILKSKNND